MTELAPPVLTLPEAEAAAVSAAYAAAEVILEYGSGGSTVVAGAVPGARVFSVESDADWLVMMQRWFDANPPQASLTLHHGDIGPTKDWGMPVNNRRVAQWPGYAHSVWDREDFVQPDVVLIDGRFRLACFLTVLFRSRDNVRVLWDDYVDRPAYHLAEKLAKPLGFHGRMAEFLVQPQRLEPNDLRWVAEAYVTPQ